MRNKLYIDHLHQLGRAIRRAALTGKMPTLDQISPVLQWREGNGMIRDLCAELKIATNAEFNQEMRRNHQREVLGVAPTSATELIEAFAIRHNLRVPRDGMLTRDVRAEIPVFNGVLQPITAADRTDPKVDLNVLDLKRELRILSSNLAMGFKRGDISRAVDVWVMAETRALEAA